MPAPALVLASASPRRRWLLAKLDVAFEVTAPELDERARPGEEPGPFAERMAEEKARAVAAARPAAWVLAADTVVAIDGAILGKPGSPAEATAMLERLAGRPHAVFTGVALLAPGGRLAARTVECTTVVFRTLTAAEIAAYLATGEPFDRAGAYAIQGEGAHLVDRVEGSYTNVIGLPVPTVAAWLRAGGLL